jgi:hypothetical protein
MERSAGGPGAAGRCLLAHELDYAPARAAVRGVEVGGGPCDQLPRPLLALQLRKWFVKDTVLIVDGALVPTRGHTIAERSKTSYVVGGSSNVPLNAENCARASLRSRRR